MRGIIKTKKAVSPMISTVLLIMIAIIIAIIILLWGRGFIKEKLLKFNEPIDNVCSRVEIKPFVNPDNTYGFTNTGNTPIYQLDLKKTQGGSSTVRRIEESVNPAASIVLGDDYGDVEEIKIIPVLLGKTSGSGKQKIYACPEKNAVVV
jgi:hypothetical protein